MLNKQYCVSQKLDVYFLVNVGYRSVARARERDDVRVTRELYRRRRAGLPGAGARRAHALVAGGARHLLHARAARHVLRAGPLRARGARGRRASARHGLLRGTPAPGRVGAHLPRGARQRGEGGAALQVGRGPAGARRRCRRGRAAHRARVARGYGPRAAQPGALSAQLPQARLPARGRAHPDPPPAGQVCILREAAFAVRRLPPELTAPPPLCCSLRKANASEEETRRAITERIQDELLRLRDKTHALIRRALGPSADGLLDDRSDIHSPAPAHTLPKPVLNGGDAPRAPRTPDRDRDSEL